jgi:hypothetical protein
MTSRRYFLKSASALAVGFAGLRAFAARVDQGAARASDGFGPLNPDPKKIIDLPRGFSASVISKAGEKMADGLRVPAMCDGMAAFAGPRGATVLVRNHEINPAVAAPAGAFGPENRLLTDEIRKKMYDPGGRLNVGLRVPCLGGTTTIVYDTKQRKTVREFLSLAGTLRNCAGGPTPWNSWITCEETIDPAGKAAAKDHGYNFEVPATDQPRLAEPVPLKAMGRFRHEAVAVDPKTGIVYQTEDTEDGLIYRFIPKAPGQLARGGRLQALIVRDSFSADTRNWKEQFFKPGVKLATQWVDLDEVESPKNDLRLRGHRKGAARFARGEGMWFGGGAIWFVCTSGGRTMHGQVWKLTPANGELELFAEPNNPALVDRADNLTVAPWGDLILCEDGPGEQFLVGVTPAGGFYKLARNPVGTSEFAGATFSPDGSTLFVNLQNCGLTLAITGPWRQ